MIHWARRALVDTREDVARRPSVSWRNHNIWGLASSVPQDIVFVNSIADRLRNESRRHLERRTETLTARCLGV
jgi:hypothetical protein